MKQEMMEWPWHLLDHIQIICISLQTDKPRWHLITQFFIGWMLFPTPNQHCQSTEGNLYVQKCDVNLYYWHHYYQ